jgi:hypothetical protein
MLLLTFLIFCSLSSFAQTKRALVIAISDYPTLPGREFNWNKLNSKNDYGLVTGMLQKQQFDKKNVISLLDDRATVENIQKAFEHLIRESEKGDIIYFHFSGHGQQIEDVQPTQNYKSKNLLKDERDGFDEALVTFNAPLKFETGYQYQDHFIDDQMNFYMSRLRKKIGGSGQIVAVFDCCHSGSATRGDNTAVVRGTSIICAPPNYSPSGQSDKIESLAFDTDFDYVNTDEMGKLTAFFACKSEQVAEEIKEDQTKVGYGSLTYYLIKSMEELGPNSSYNNLFSKINEHMVLGFKNRQQPEVEGDNLNQLIFRGSFIDQKPYHLITDVNSSEISINAGSLQGLSVGDSIGIFSNTTTDTKGQTPLYRGKVTHIETYSSTVELTEAFDSRKDAEVKYRAFITYQSTPPIKARLFIDVKSKILKSELVKLFENEKAIELTNSDFDYRIIDTLYQGNPGYVMVFLGSDRERPLRAMTPRLLNGDVRQADSLKRFIKQSMKTDMFRRLNMEEELLSFSYRILPCSADGNCTYDTTQPLKNNMRFYEKSKFQLRIKNTGAQRIFMNLIDIDPTNMLTWFSGSDMKNSEFMPGVERRFNITITKPYGVEQIKMIGTNKPVDFSSLQENGSGLTRGAGSNPLLDYVDESVNGTRSASGSDAMGATVKTLTFEVMKIQ